MASGIYIGSLELSKAALGSDEVEVYLGDELLWPQNVPVAYKARITLTGGTTVDIPLNGSSTLTSGEVRSNVSSINDIAALDISSAVTSIANRCFSGTPNMSSVTWTESITNVGEGAFMWCSGLTSITIPSGSNNLQVSSITFPSGVTSLNEWVFQRCTGLTSIHIPSGITSVASNTFGNCSGLTSITVDAANANYDSRNGCNAIIHTSSNKLVQGCQNTVIPGNIKIIGNSAFSEIRNLTACTIPSGVTSIEQYAFHWCNGLTGITIEATTPPTLAANNFDEGNHPIFVPCGTLTAYTAANRWSSLSSRIQEYGCAKATLTLTGGTTVSVPDDGLDTLEQSEVLAVVNDISDIASAAISSSVTAIGDNAFDSAPNMTAVTLPSTLVTIGTEAFYGDPLTGITFPYSLTTIGDDAFFDCSSITSLTIPSGVTYIGYECFQQCSGLTGVTFEGATPPTFDENVFEDTNNCPIYVPCNSVSAYQTALHNEFSDYSSRVTCVQVQAKATLTLTGGTTVSISGDGTTTLTKNEVLAAVGGSSEKSAITEAVITEEVTKIGIQAFSNCQNMTAVTISSSVTSISDWAFEYCSGLQSVTVEAATPPTLGGSGVFTGSTCPIYVPCASVNTYQSANYWNYYASRITCVHVPAKATCTLTGGTVVEIPENGSSTLTSAEVTAATSGNSSRLVAIDISSSVTSIAASCFQQYTNLSSVTWTDSLTSIGNSAFRWCGKLQNVTIPSGVTSIGASTFQYCTAFTSVYIHSGITSIAENGFGNCSGLTSITVDAANANYDSRNNCNAIIHTARNAVVQGCQNTVIPGNITAIDGSAFSEIRNLTACTVPSGVTSIGQYAFHYCNGLTGITIEATTPPTLGANNFDAGNHPIFVPCGTLTAYTAANRWSSLSSRLQEYGCAPAGGGDTVTVNYITFDVELDEEEEHSVELTGITSLSRSDIESIVTIHNQEEDYDEVHWDWLRNIVIGSGVTAIGDGALNFGGDDADLPEFSLMQYVKFEATTPPTFGNHVFGGDLSGNQCWNSIRYIILVPSASTTAYTTAISTQINDIEGIWPSDVPSMIVREMDSCEPGDPEEELTYTDHEVYGPATRDNMYRQVGMADGNGEYNIYRCYSDVWIGSATTSISDNAFYNDCPDCGGFGGCMDAIIAWHIDTDTVTSIGDSAFEGVKMSELWMDGNTSVPTLGTGNFTGECDEWDDEAEDYVTTQFNYPIYVEPDLLTSYENATNWSDFQGRVQSPPGV